MEAPPLTPAQRVELLIERLEITPYQFAKATGLSHQTISNLLTGKNKPGFDTLEAIAKRYPQSATWLLTGKGHFTVLMGDMLLDGHEVISTLPPAPAAPTDQEPEPPAGGAAMRINKDGELEGMPALVGELRARLADKDKELDRVYEQLAAWQEAYRKPWASADAAAPTVSTPIGPRFDNRPAMWVAA